MLKKALLTAAAASLALVFTGCSSFQTATNLNGVQLSTDPSRTAVAHVHAEIWGVYIFGSIPIFTGSTIMPERCAMFEDNVTIPRTIGMATKLTKARLNAQYLDALQSESSSCWLFPTLIFWYKSIQVSGNALR